MSKPSIFAVMHIKQGDASPTFSVVAATDAAEAIQATAKACIDAGHPDTAIVAVFDRNDLSHLDDQMKQAEDSLPKGE